MNIETELFIKVKAEVLATEEVLATAWIRYSVQWKLTSQTFP